MGKDGIFHGKMQYVCPKCGCTQYESDQFQATGGNFAKLFDVQNKRFVTVSCTNCGYTELYQSGGSAAGMCLISCLAADRRKDRKQKGDACFSAASPSDGVVFMLEISPRKRCPCPARFPPGSCRRALARSSAPLQGPARRCSLRTAAEESTR